MAERKTPDPARGGVGPHPIHHENLEEKTYRHLKEMIFDRKLVPGRRLALSQLALDLGVSRTPLVNALKRLAQEQLVEWVARRGIYVRLYSKHEMADLYEVRAALEGLAARLTAERAGEAEIDRLEGMFRGVDLRPTPVAVRRYVDLDRKFHWQLVELSGNHQLMTALKAINMRIFAYQYGLLARTTSESLQEHRRILEALRARDGAACDRLMRAHHGRTAEKLRREAEAEGRRPRGGAIDSAAG